MHKDGNWDVFFLLLFQKGKEASKESQNQQHLNINFDTMVDLIYEESVSAWDIMFWKRTSNPQSGETYDFKNETYTLWRQVYTIS